MAGDRIAELGAGSVTLTLLVALLLGLRHATDPDHLTAVSTLVLSEPGGLRRAIGLAAMWGAGHATMLVVLGLPVVAFDAYLPAAAARAAELAVGVLIVALALRLLLRWRRGTLHVHPHRHGDLVHAHPHVHDHAGAHEHAHGHAVAHEHAHAQALGRAPRVAFAIGLVHGVGGSAGVGVLVVAGASSAAAGVMALLVFAAGAAVSMAAASAAFGQAIVRTSLLERLVWLVPALGIASLLFGTWYVLAALETAAYPF